LDCALELEAGNKFIENYLSFSEFGLRYYAIPNFLFKKDDVINSLFKYYLNHKDEKSYYNVIAKDEDEILEEAEALDNLIEFKFLFYEKSNSAFNILSYVESVIPSWIGNLYRNQKAINQNPLFKEDLVKVIFSKKEDFAGDFKEIVNEGRKYNHINNSNWVFGFLRDFYASDKSNKYYIDLISSIFSGKKVNFDFILSSAMNKIRTNFRQDREYSVKIFTLEFLMLFKFLKKVSLLIDHGEKMENETFVESFGDENQFLKYLNELDNPAKKASFLLGILTRKLIAVQYKELGSTPFTNKLWGLSVDEKKIKKLYPMVINKLNEYKITNSELTQDISINLLQTNDNWNLSRDETSFYFVLGYTLNKLYKRPKKGE
jgi:CRISPR-associated protein Csh1